jgi:hypothetical protein
VTGFDDVELSRFTEPALSTVRIDRAAFASSAVDLLAERIADPTGTPRTITVPHRLIVATAPPPPARLDARALTRHRTARSLPARPPRRAIHPFRDRSQKPLAHFISSM